MGFWGSLKWRKSGRCSGSPNFVFRTVIGRRRSDRVTTSQEHSSPAQALQCGNQMAGVLVTTQTGARSCDRTCSQRLTPDRVCPLVCEKGERAAGDHCVEIGCASGYYLNSHGSCEKRHEPVRKQRTVTREFAPRRTAPYLAAPLAPAAPHADIFNLR